MEEFSKKKMEEEQKGWNVNKSFATEPSKTLREIMSEQLVQNIAEIDEKLEETENDDFLLAQKLQFAEEIEAEEENKHEINSKPKKTENSEEFDDFAIALQLQEEENNRFYSSRNFNESEKVRVVSEEQNNELLQDYRNLSLHECNQTRSRDEEETQKLIENMMRFKISQESRKPNWPRRNKNLKGQGGDDEIITKHDYILNGRRNVRRLADTKIKLNTGDLGQHPSLKIRGKVMKSLEKKVKTQMKRNLGTTDDFLKTFAKQLDSNVLLSLQSLINLNVLKEVTGVIKSGKEGYILRGVGFEIESLNSEIKTFLESINSFERFKQFKPFYAVKVYKTTLSEFKTRIDYIKGDHRFHQVLNLKKQNPKKILKIWSEKEFKNLCKLAKNQIPAPIPIKLHDNILLMTFLGKGDWPAKQLKELNVSKNAFYRIYIECCLLLRAMYVKCKLIHADFSEYNVLYFEKRCFIIDVGQSVLKEHPKAEEFLIRDCSNLIRFFKSTGLTNLISSEKLFEFITFKQNDLEETQVEEEEEVETLVAKFNFDFKVVQRHFMKLAWVDDEVLLSNNLSMLFNAEEDVK